MKYVCCFQDLTALGIEPLTGEACGLSYRLLCDVTAQGRHVIEKCLGVQLTLPEAWNSGKADDPHVGSIMLAQEMFLPLAIFALLESGCREAWKIERGLAGIERTDAAEEIERARRVHPPLRRFAYRGTAGDRNVHQMSGRVQ